MSENSQTERTAARERSLSTLLRPLGCRRAMTEMGYEDPFLGEGEGLLRVVFCRLLATRRRAAIGMKAAPRLGDQAPDFIDE